jgi:hypothetical protein
MARLLRRHANMLPLRGHAVVGCVAGPLHAVPNERLRHVRRLHLCRFRLRRFQLRRAFSW